MLDHCLPVRPCLPVHPYPRVPDARPHGEIVAPPPAPGQDYVFVSQDVSEGTVDGSGPDYGGGSVPVLIILFCIIMLIVWTREVFFGKVLVDYKVTVVEKDRFDIKRN